MAISMSDTMLDMCYYHLQIVPIHAFMLARLEELRYCDLSWITSLIEQRHQEHHSTIFADTFRDRANMNIVEPDEAPLTVLGRLGLQMHVTLRNIMLNVVCHVTA